MKLLVEKGLILLLTTATIVKLSYYKQLPTFDVPLTSVHELIAYIAKPEAWRLCLKKP